MNRTLRGLALGLALAAALIPALAAGQVVPGPGGIGKATDDAADTATQDCSLICLTKYLNLDLDGINGKAGTISTNLGLAKDSLAALVNAAASVALKPTAAAAACKVLLATAGTFYTASGVAAAAGYVLVYDSATDPGDGSGKTPIAVAQLPAAGSWSLIAGPPIAVANGATACTSSTGPYVETKVTSAALAGNFITGQAN